MAQKTEYVAAIEAILSEARLEVAGRMADLTDKTLDVVEHTLDTRTYDRCVQLRAAIVLLQLSGVGKAASSRSGQERPSDQAAMLGNIDLPPSGAAQRCVRFVSRDMPRYALKVRVPAVHIYLKRLVTIES